MGWYPCPECCRRACPRWTDRFNRADSTDLGPDWEEVSGDWSIGSNALNEAGTLGALVVAQPHPQGENISFHLAVDTIGEAQDDVFRVVVNYLNEDNYHFAEYARDVLVGGERKSFLRLYSRLSGFETLLQSAEFAPLDTEHTLVVCFTATLFYFGVGNEGSTWITDPTAIVGGYQAGLGNGANQPIDFDNFVFQEHYQTNRRCPQCVCHCGATPAPMRLLLTITCELPVILDGFEVDVDVDSTTGSYASQPVDHGTADCGEDQYPLGGISYQLDCVYIAEADETEWTLTVQRGVPEGITIRTSGSCAPFTLTFVGQAVCVIDYVPYPLTYTITERP